MGNCCFQYNGSLFSIDGGGTPSNYDLIGEIYNKSSWNNLSDFTQVGSAFSVSANKINLSSSNGDYNQYLILPNSNLDRNYTFEVTFKANQNPTGSTYGISIGKKSINGWFAFQQFIHFVATTNPYIRMVTGSNAQISSSSTINYSINDILKITLIQKSTVLNLLLENLTTKATISLNNVESLIKPNVFSLSNSSNWGIFSHGGSWTIQNINIFSNTLSNPNTLFIGDSKTYGYSSEILEKSFPDVIKKKTNKSIAVYAGGSDRTGELILDLDYLESKFNTCKNVVLNIGRNDLNSGISSTIWNANYTSIVSRLKAKFPSAKFIHLMPIPEIVQSNQSALSTFISSNFPSDTLLDVSSLWVNATHLYSDNVHPNITGHELIADQLIPILN